MPAPRLRTLPVQALVGTHQLIAACQPRQLAIVPRGPGVERSLRGQERPHRQTLDMLTDRLGNAHEKLS